MCVYAKNLILDKTSYHAFKNTHGEILSIILLYIKFIYIFIVAGNIIYI